MTKYRVVLDIECPHLPNIPVGKLGEMTVTTNHPPTVVFDGSHAQYSRFVVDGVYKAHVGMYVRVIGYLDPVPDDEEGDGFDDDDDPELTYQCPYPLCGHKSPAHLDKCEMCGMEFVFPDDEVTQKIEPAELTESDWDWFDYESNIDISGDDYNLLLSELDM